MVNSLGQKEIPLERATQADDTLYFVQGLPSPGSLIEYFLGYIHPQALTSCLASVALSPRENSYVLDMCAAPGGKTSHLAQLMNNTGLLVANELYLHRHIPLGHTLTRLGVLNTVLTAYQAQEFPLKQRFDYILADVPCSGEGRLRRTKEAATYRERNEKTNLSELQKKIILRGFDLLKDKGKMLYATSVRITRKRTNQWLIFCCRIVKLRFFLSRWVSIINLVYLNGEMSSMINNWNSPPDFIPTSTIPWDSSWPGLAREDERHSLFSYLEERFGIPEKLFDDYLFFKKKNSWWLLRRVAHIELASQLKVSKVGIKAFQRVGAFVKPTTRMIQIFGGAANRARLEIDTPQLIKLLAGEALYVDLAVEKGYMILSLGENRILGLGFFINGRVRSQIPRKELRQSMLQISPQGSASVGRECGLDND